MIRALSNAMEILLFVLFAEGAGVISHDVALAYLIAFVFVCLFLLMLAGMALGLMYAWGWFSLHRKRKLS